MKRDPFTKNLRKRKIGKWYTRKDRRYKRGPRAGKPLRRPATDFEKPTSIIIQMPSQTQPVPITVPTPTTRYEPERIKLSGSKMELGKLLETLAKWDVESIKMVQLGKSLKPMQLKMPTGKIIRSEITEEKDRTAALEKEIELEKQRQEKERIRGELGLEREKIRLERAKQQMEGKRTSKTKELKPPKEKIVEGAPKISKETSKPVKAGIPKIETPKIEATKVSEVESPKITPIEIEFRPIEIEAKFEPTKVETKTVEAKIPEVRSLEVKPMEARAPEVKAPEVKPIEVEFRPIEVKLETGSEKKVSTVGSDEST